MQTPDTAKTRAASCQARVAVNHWLFPKARTPHLETVCIVRGVNQHQINTIANTNANTNIQVRLVKLSCPRSNLSYPTMEPSCLSILPTELLCQVALNLDVRDYNTLRLTCKQLESRTFDPFARKYFSERRVFRTEQKLQSLIDISKSRLCSFVKSVIILIRSTEFDDLTIEGFPPNEEGLARYDEMKAKALDDKILCSTGQDRVLLTEAFSNLHLDTVGLHGLIVQDGRYDGIVLDPVGLITCHQSLLLALGQSNARVKRFEASGMEYTGLSPTGLRIPPYLEKSIVPVLHRLESLHLTLKPDPRSLRLISSDEGKQSPILNYDLRAFLGHTTNLKSLYLSLGRFTPDDFFAWLASGPVRPGERQPDLTARPNPSPPVLNQLGNLALHNINIKVLDLMAAVKKLPALKELSLLKISLVAEASPHAPSLPCQHSQVFPNFLQKLKHCVDLQRFAIMDPCDVVIQEEVPHMKPWAFWFHSSKTKAFSYAGDQTARAINLLVVSMGHDNANNMGPTLWNPDEELGGGWSTDPYVVDPYTMRAPSHRSSLRYMMGETDSEMDSDAESDLDSEIDSDLDDDMPSLEDFEDLVHDAGLPLSGQAFLGMMAAAAAGAAPNGHFPGWGDYDEGDEEGYDGQSNEWEDTDEE
ncbi:hypothetical protein F4778DRAFT_298349 [Xylariomycetidae sp. FL2044]|nr:hypothetical protein F4778DRAFT_298349 [Xylariomycetidae sp. FL2044]